MLENHPSLGRVLISSPALAFTAVATKMTMLPGLLGKRPHLLSQALLAFIESKERATAEADIEPQEGPTSIHYLLDELALLPGTQLSIDPELVPPLHVLHNSAITVFLSCASYSANCFTWRQCFSFSLLFGGGSFWMALAAESTKKQIKHENHLRMSFRMLGSSTIFFVSE